MSINPKIGLEEIYDIASTNKTFLLSVAILNHKS